MSKFDILFYLNIDNILLTLHIIKISQLIAISINDFNTKSIG